MPSKVLLAGSDRMLQQMAGTFDAGQIHTASTSDGYEALCLLNETIPDLLIAEIDLPQKDGYTLCRYVRQEPEFQSLPVILLDHEFNTFNQRRALAVGADVYLSQPLSPDELIEAVHGLLASKEASDDVTGDEKTLSASATTRPQLVARAADSPLEPRLHDEAAQSPPAQEHFDAEAAPPPLVTRRPNHFLFGAVAIAAILIAISLALLMRAPTPDEQAVATDKSSGALATTGQPVVTAPEPEMHAAVVADAVSPAEATSSPDTSNAAGTANQDASAAADADTVAHANAPSDTQTSEDRQDAAKPADATAARTPAPAVGERRNSAPTIRPYSVRPARANHWRSGGQEMVASGEHFGSGAKHFGKGSASAALWASRKAGGGIKRIGSAIKRIF
ncbi:MAG: PleD family two-component system response regulator [Blastocatellia bacterium]